MVCWGNSCEGGDCSRVAEQLKDVRQLCAAQWAFCALRADGSTVSWGVVTEGGGSYMVPGLKKIWLWLGGRFLERLRVIIHIHNWGAKELRTESPNDMIAGQTRSLRGWFVRLMGTEAKKCGS